MIKLTRRLKKNKKNRTFKRGGASIDVKPHENQIKEELPKQELQKEALPKQELQKEELPKQELQKEELPKQELQKTEREGIVDIIGDKITDKASSLSTFIGDAGLKIIGLERINKTKENDESGIVGNIANKTGAALIENVNEVLGTATTDEASKKMADIIKESAKTFNEALNDPKVKAELEEAIKNAGEISDVVVESAKEPIGKAVDIAANSVSKATSAIVSSIPKVATDAAAAFPGIGAVIELGKILNDGSKAASAAFEAGSQLVEASSDAFIETKKNVEEGLNALDEQKKLAEKISNRVNYSIKEFGNPIEAVGGRKTKRRLLKHRGKSKRVRFSI